MHHVRFNGLSIVIIIISKGTISAPNCDTAIKIVLGFNIITGPIGVLRSEVTSLGGGVNRRPILDALQLLSYCLLSI